MFLLWSGLVAACGPREGVETPGTAGERYEVVTTTGMITDIVREIVGEHGDVFGLIGEGTDPHLYKPTRADVVRLRGGDIIFYNGRLLEGAMTDVLVQLRQKGKPVHAVAEAPPVAQAYAGWDAGRHDPHIWMDVAGWARVVSVVAEALSAFDPAHAEDYAQRARAYQEQLAELDAYAREVVASIPENHRILVTAHDAFSYLGRAYGLEVRGIQGLSTESEAGMQDLEELVSLVANQEIPAVFVESSVADKNVRALLEGAHAKGHTVVLGGELFSDAMGPAGTYEGTYIGMIDHNVTTIARALGGTAPEKGMRGRLSDRR